MASKWFAVAMMLAAASAEAGSANGTLSVTAQVSVACAINTATLAFSSYDAVQGTAVQGSTTLSVVCTKGATAVVTLGQGSQPALGSTDTAPQRQMALLLSRLGYTLYQDSARTVVWGNTSATGLSYIATGSSLDSLTVYGTITASQDVPAGSYADSVVATMTF
ncbi:MAG TPA: spore coat U domain-containing protein [Kofleriaceae bacterium]